MTVKKDKLIEFTNLVNECCAVMAHDYVADWLTKPNPDLNMDTPLDAFNQAVARIPEIEQAHLIAGNFDYLMKIRTKSMKDYRRVLAERISTLPHVASTSTYVAMQAVKENGYLDIT